MDKPTLTEALRKFTGETLYTFMTGVGGLPELGGTLEAEAIDLLGNQREREEDPPKTKVEQIQRLLRKTPRWVKSIAVSDLIEELDWEHRKYGWVLRSVEEAVNTVCTDWERKGIVLVRTKSE